jgi:hypothetical protein
VSIVDHPVWDEIRPYWDVQSYDRDCTAKSGPRYRLELRKLPRPLSLRLRQLRQPCVACGREVQVLRQRRGSDGHDLYYAPSCPVAESAACSRGTEASIEYARVRAALEGSPLPPTQDGLFEVRSELGLDPKPTPPPPDLECQPDCDCPGCTNGIGCVRYVEFPPVPDPPPRPKPKPTPPAPAPAPERRHNDCVICRRPAICACEAPLRRGPCARPMCESCATTVSHLRNWVLCPGHAAEHFQGAGPLWVRRDRQ